MARQARLIRFEPHPAEPDAEVGQRGNLQLDLGAVGEGMVVEFLFAHETHERHESSQAEAQSSRRLNKATAPE
jgi:hypothetical protein